MKTDTRPPWKIAAAIRLQSATGYLRLLNLDEHKQQVYEKVYKTGNLKQWVNEHVKRLISDVNQAAECTRTELRCPYCDGTLERKTTRTGIEWHCGCGWYQD